MNRWMAEKLKAGRSEKGMSLVELVVGIALLLILITGVLFFFYFGIRNFKLAQARGMLKQEADKVMEGTVRQLRVASSFMVPVGSGWVGNPIYFEGDVRGDGTPSNVMFYLTGDNKLMRSDSSTGTVEIADRVTALEFTYYGKDGQSLLPPDSITDGTDGNRTSIKTVQIRLVMERPVPGWSPISTERIGTVVIRSKLS
jgi:type II secretory pathway pseudopilin PulG